MFRRVVSATAMALLVVACAKNAESPQLVEKAADITTIALHFNAADGLNPAANGVPAPVRVRIFELKNAAGFSRADYFALAECAPGTLGPDLLDQDEVLLQPGQRLTVDRTLNAATRQVGLVVGYREIDRAQWRLLVDVALRETREFQIGLDPRAVSNAAAAHPTRPAQ